MKRKLTALAALALAVCMLLSFCASAGSADMAGNTTADNIMTIKNTNPSQQTADSEKQTTDSASIEDEAGLLDLLANIKAEDIILLSEPSLSAEGTCPPFEQGAKAADTA